MVQTEEIGYSTMQNMSMEHLEQLKVKFQDILHQQQKKKSMVIQNIIWIQNELKQYQAVGENND